MKALSVKIFSFLSTCTLSCWCLLASVENQNLCQSHLYNQFIHERNLFLEDDITWVSNKEQNRPNESQVSAPELGSGYYYYGNFNQGNGSEANFSQYTPLKKGSSTLEIYHPTYGMQQEKNSIPSYQGQACSIYHAWNQVSETPKPEEEAQSLQPGYYAAEDYRSSYLQDTNGYRGERDPPFYGRESWEKGQRMTEMAKGEEGVDPPSQEYQDSNYPGYSYRYELEYYNEWKCEYEPKYCYKRHCRYVPQYYQKKCCVYVPQYYYVTRCAYVPEYYYSVKRYESPHYFSVPKCRYVKRYFKNNYCQACASLAPDDLECVNDE
ncbi:MAG: hypothetical protein ACSNEK_08895 [Parachlamydiaceae bacterium]